MPTIQQLLRNKRKVIKQKTKSPALKNCPVSSPEPDTLS